MFKRQIDLRSEPVGRVVALGESTTWGYSVSSKEKCWVNQVVRMLEEFQGAEIELINQGIGSNVLTPKCPAYPHSSGLAAIERVDGDVIDHDPDMVFLSYGLNDSRGGTPTETFREEYQRLIDRIRARIDPVIVIVNTYYMHEVLYDHPGAWDQGSYDVTEIYNLVIEQLAKENGLILADVYSAEVGVDWIIDVDHCHPNDLGHRIIANRVFEAITRSCSFVACRMPEESLIQAFGARYGNGPDRPSSGGGRAA
jgi:lysophospholipase L1-like esterase